MSGLSAADVRKTVPASPMAFTGRAIVWETSGKKVGADVRVDAGLLPPEGGARRMASLSETIPNVASAETLHASTMGQERRCHSEASLANLKLTVGGLRIEARFIGARSSAIIRNGRVYVAGRSEIIGLTVNGRLISPSGQPNQRIPLPQGHLILNEQKSTISSSTGDLVVRALQVMVNDAGIVNIGFTQAGLTMGTPRRCEGDFVTGSGWIDDGTGRNRLPFCFAVGNRQGILEGHFNFVDPRGIRVASNKLLTYTAVDSNTRLITGTLDYNGVPSLWYRLEVTDASDSGRSDQFTLILANTYAVRGVLQGGNVTLFRCP